MLVEIVARFAVAASSAGLLATGLAVLAMELRSKRPAPVERAGGPLAAVNFVGILGFAGLGAASAIWRFGSIRLAPGPVDTVVRILGIACLAAAGLLAAWGLRTIGRQMSSQAEVRPDTELVTGGAFGLVRHPLYLSILMLWAGGTLALLSWVLALCTLVLVPLLVARSRLEEELLLRHFGAAYASYASRVPMLLPRFGVPRQHPGRPPRARAPRGRSTPRGRRGLRQPLNTCIYIGCPRPFDCPPPSRSASTRSLPRPAAPRRSTFAR